MYRLINSSRVLFLVTVLIVMLVAQVVNAQGRQEAAADQNSPGIPEWVAVRQQYDIRYVYVPSNESVPAVPQWVKDRQQYETTYVTGQSLNLQPAEIAFDIPQWVRDRQQYEATYVYEPVMSNTR